MPGLQKFMGAGAVEAHSVALVEDVGLVGNVAFQCALLDKHIFLSVGGMAFGQVFFSGHNGYGEDVKTPGGRRWKVTSGRK